MEEAEAIDHGSGGLTMPIARTYHLICSDCGDHCTIAADTAAEARIGAQTMEEWETFTRDGKLVDLCPDCDRASARPPALSPIERVLRTRASRIAAGLCQFCGKEPPLPGRKWGATCKGKQAERIRRERERELRREGVH